MLLQGSPHFELIQPFIHLNRYYQRNTILVKDYEHFTYIEHFIFWSVFFSQKIFLNSHNYCISQYIRTDLNNVRDDFIH